MKVIGIVAVAVCAIGLVAPALAASNKDVDNCYQQQDSDLQLASCTRILNRSGLKPDERYHALVNRCLGWGRKNQYDRALADCDEAKRIRPNIGIAYNNAGIIYNYRAENERAIAAFSEAVRLNPRDGMALKNRADVFDDMNQLDRALADLNEAIRIDPKLYDAYTLRAIVWRKQGEYDRALADANQAIRLQPKYGEGYSSRGAIWRMKGDLERALVDQDKAIQIAPKFLGGYLRRAETYRYKGDYERAFADYDLVLRLDPGLISALTGRGLTYERMGDLARARAEFEKAVNSQHPLKGHGATEPLATARARLSALDSGAPQPVIPAAPSRASSSTAVPTLAVTPASAPVAKPAQGRRVALVIGNSAYKTVPALTNPQRDADAIAKSLRAIGFGTVTLASDASREKLADALRSFANEAEKADWAVVYYAGHGMEVNGVNYLIPVDAKLAVDRDVQFEAVPLDQVMASVEGAKKLKLVLLDACRDNPFAPQMRRTTAPDAVAANSTAGGTVGSRSVGRGLGEVKVAGATLVVYAAKHGQTALDGEGGNSPFAVAVVQRLATPNVEINKLFRLVRDDVMEATAGRQEPYTYGSLPGREDFFFVQR